MMRQHRDHAGSRVERAADIVVIGGGVMGVAAAYWLARRGLDVMLFEAHRLAGGASGRNAGLMLAAASPLEDLTRVEDMLAREQIDARFVRCGHLALAASDAMLQKMHEEVARRPAGAAPLAVLDRRACEDLLGLRINDVFRGGRWFPGGAAIDPVRFVRGLASAAVRHGARILERTPVRRVARLRGADAVTVETPAGVVRARHVVVAAQANSGALLPGVARCVQPVRGQMLASLPMPPLFPVAMAVDWGAVYWRQTAEGAIVLGGCRGADPQTELTARARLNPLIQAALARFLAAAFPGAPPIEIARRWAGIMDETRDGRPIVGPWDGDATRWIAAGFAGHGLPPALGVGQALAESIAGGRTSTALDPYDPARFVSATPTGRRAGARAEPS